MRAGWLGCGSRARVRGGRGFTLLEVLVALFVVALGVAGAAGLQALAMRAAFDATRLSDGTRLAASLAQRMRANPVGMALPDGANPYLQFDADVDAGVGAEPVTSCYAGAGCSPAQLASFDLAETAAALAERFPGGRMRVCRDAQGSDASGRLSWACTGGLDAPVAIKLGWRGQARGPGQPSPQEDADLPAVFLALGSGTP